MLADANPLARAICFGITVYWFVLLARILLAWFPAPPSGPIRAVSDLIFDVTEPVLRPFRNLIPPIRTGAVALDLSPIILFIILAVLQQVICF
jgi:YggT family protein